MIPAVDAHAHLGRWLTDWVGRPGEWMTADVPALLDILDANAITTVINLDGRWGAELESNLDRYDRAHPGRFRTFCHVDWTDLAGAAASLTASVNAGAAGLKVWKDLGLHVRDDSGTLVLPDDPRLDPLWSTAGSLGVPVFIHTADPAAFFEPVDDHNELADLLRQRPEWSYADPRYPRFPRLMAALETIVANHPGTVFVGLHAASWPENPAWLSHMLCTYPNFNIDIAARVAALGRSPAPIRDLFLRHPSRILFGTDQLPLTGTDYPTYRRFLETPDHDFPHSPEDPPLLGNWLISGLDLPAPVLQAIYSDNARRLIPL